MDNVKSTLREWLFANLINISLYIDYLGLSESLGSGQSRNSIAFKNGCLAFSFIWNHNKDCTIETSRNERGAIRPGANMQARAGTQSIFE